MIDEKDPDPHEIVAEILLDRPDISAVETNTDARSGAQYIDITYDGDSHGSDFNFSKNITRRFLREGLIVTALRVDARVDPDDARMWVNEIQVTGTEFEADI